MVEGLSWVAASAGAVVSARDRHVLSVDPVESEPPYLYVRGNPINRVDPSGLCEGSPTQYSSCWNVYHQLIQKYPGLNYYPHLGNDVPLHELPEYRLRELLLSEEPPLQLIVRGSSSNVQALIRLFEADHFPGKDAVGRLRWILAKTASPRFLSLHFALFPADDSGFCEDLADQKFYNDAWQTTDPGPSKQMGHFLTAVSLGFDPETAYRNTALLFDTVRVGTTPYILPGNSPPTAEEFALNLIIGHEMVGDRLHIGQAVSIPAQYNAATAEARNHFLNAVRHDRLNNHNSRESELRAILVATDPEFEDADAIAGPYRVGNSMQDLRLSVKGWRFGQEVRNGYSPVGPLQTRRQAAAWLRREVYDPARTRGSLGY